MSIFWDLILRDFLTNLVQEGQKEIKNIIIFLFCVLGHMAHLLQEGIFDINVTKNFKITLLYELIFGFYGIHHFHTAANAPYGVQ